MVKYEALSCGDKAVLRSQGSDVREIKALSENKLGIFVGHCSTSKHPNSYRLTWLWQFATTQTSSKIISTNHTLQWWGLIYRGEIIVRVLFCFFFLLSALNQISSSPRMCQTWASNQTKPQPVCAPSRSDLKLSKSEGITYMAFDIYTCMAVWDDDPNLPMNWLTALLSQKYEFKFPQGIPQISSSWHGGRLRAQLGLFFICSYRSASPPLRVRRGILLSSQNDGNAAQHPPVKSQGFCACATSPTSIRHLKQNSVVYKLRTNCIRQNKTDERKVNKIIVNWSELCLTSSSFHTMQSPCIEDSSLYLFGSTWLNILKRN